MLVDLCVASFTMWVWVKTTRGPPVLVFVSIYQGSKLGNPHPCRLGLFTHAAAESAKPSAPSADGRRRWAELSSRLTSQLADQADVTAGASGGARPLICFGGFDTAMPWVGGYNEGHKCGCLRNHLRNHELYHLRNPGF